MGQGFVGWGLPAGARPHARVADRRVQSSAALRIGPGWHCCGPTDTLQRALAS